VSTISDGATTITPTLVLGHNVEAESRNVIHPILGGGVDVTLRDALPRTGTLVILCEDPAAAYAMFALHRAGAVLTYTDTDIPAASMDYVVVGTPRLDLDEETRVVTLVEAPFQEVLL
jgi:hypothetical protein